MSSKDNINNILFDFLPIGLTLTRLDGSIIASNPAFYQIIGSSQKDICNKNCWELTPSDYKAQEEEQLKSLQDIGQYGPYEKEYYHIEGHRVPVRLQGHLINHNGENLVWSSVEDLSKIKRAEREVKQFKATLDKTLDCVFMFKSDTFNVFYVNDGAVKQFGYSSDELLGMTPADIKPGISDEQFREIISSLISSNEGVTTFETVYQHKNGSQIPVEIFLQYIPLAGDESYFLEIVRNITERKAFEKLLTSYNDRLENTLRLRTAALLKAKEKAEQESSAKSKYLSSMNHELRTPLTAMLGYSELIELTSNEQNVIDNAKEIINGGYYLLELINGILDLSKIESGKVALSIKNYSLNDIILQVLSLLQPIADKKGIRIINNTVTETDIEVMVDEMQFKQVLINIISNAIKYNVVHGEVIIDYSCDDENMLHLSVSDSGIGLTFEQQLNIFEPFYRAGADKNKVEGTGLGLSISRSLMEQMGGEISVTSEAGIGSCFQIQIPSAKKTDTIQ